MELGLAGRLPLSPFVDTGADFIAKQCMSAGCVQWESCCGVVQGECVLACHLCFACNRRRCRSAASLVDSGTRRTEARPDRPDSTRVEATAPRRSALGPGPWSICSRLASRSYDPDDSSFNARDMAAAPAAISGSSAPAALSGRKSAVHSMREPPAARAWTCALAL